MPSPTLGLDSYVMNEKGCATHIRRHVLSVITFVILNSPRFTLHTKWAGRWMREVAEFASFYRKQNIVVKLWNKSEDILVDIHNSRDKLQSRKNTRLLLWVSPMSKVQEKLLPEAVVYASKLENELVLLWLCDKSEDILVDIHKSRDKLQPRKSARLLWICIQITTYFTTATYYMIDREIDQYDICNQIMPKLAFLISNHL